MGCIQSSSNPTTPSSSSGSTPSISKLTLTQDLNSYQEAIKSDPNLQSFDSNLQYRTSQAINSLALEVEVRSLSLNSLKEVTTSLLDMNQEVVNILIESKEDIWNNDELFVLVQDFFDLSLLTLDFCTSLQGCLKNARHSLSFINVAINHFDKDGGGDYLGTLDYLKRFEGCEGMFSEEFFDLFHAVYARQVKMLKKLQVQKEKVDKKMRNVETWRRLWSMGKWVNSLWKKYEMELKGQRELINAMSWGSFIVIKDLDNIKALVDKLGVEMEGLVRNAQFAINEEEQEAVGVAVDEMKTTVNDFAKTIDELSDYSDTCCRDVRNARSVIVRKITKYPSGSV
ncbi:hypothetical protein CTI12_AA079820 [Artemisia annua]|uniref:Uncharacterized protein n=1 Tax=Artemisia annua TaxID=35608 RepID=A0A2U1Q2T5_ARTAN|nr:hypothetical protein CTI12_AA079820 [Artemisia annua]